MRRLFTIAAVVLAAGSVIFARSGMQAPGQEPEPEKKLIDLKSDNMGPIAPGDSVIFLVGNFAAQHNGAVITCDSAVRYSDMRIEFFGNVLINKNTTYIYGDRAEYNGELNEARVYSDIVKVAEVVRVIRESGLPNRTTSMFTEIEGDWDEVMQVVRDATFVLASKGIRTEVVLKADIRPGFTDTMTGKLERMEAQIKKQEEAR